MCFQLKRSNEVFTNICVISDLQTDAANMVWHVCLIMNTKRAFLSFQQRGKVNHQNSVQFV